MLKVRPKLKVLIVDDSELNREMLGSMLGNEYEILEAENGAQAIEILRGHISRSISHTSGCSNAADGWSGGIDTYESVSLD